MRLYEDMAKYVVTELKKCVSEALESNISGFFGKTTHKTQLFFTQSPKELLQQKPIETHL